MAITKLGCTSWNAHQNLQKTKENIFWKILNKRIYYIQPFVLGPTMDRVKREPNICWIGWKWNCWVYCWSNEGINGHWMDECETGFHNIHIWRPSVSSVNILQWKDTANSSRNNYYFIFQCKLLFDTINNWFLVRITVTDNIYLLVPNVLIVSYNLFFWNVLFFY